MAAKVYYDDDADLSLLKDKTIAIIGYGSQGHAQAQNLRDSGCNVIIGQRPGGPNYDLAISHGFKPMSAADAAAQGDLVNILLPDELQGDVYRNDIRPNLKSGNLLMCSHGFNIHFGQVVPPAGVDAALVAPKGPGHLVRSEYEAGGGVPSLIALSEGASETSRQLALAYAKGIGGTRGGVIETSFAEETETDLFGEQVVLCGGVSALVKAGFETLVEEAAESRWGFIGKKVMNHQLALARGQHAPLAADPGESWRVVGDHRLDDVAVGARHPEHITAAVLVRKPAIVFSHG